ncbi:hypothetical protein AKJ53_01045 [candidate division MSBL1 archaeon SCGC-AAA382F02]|uniref:Uncharacterized protein n=1 Tax=candidate division MSBL1 archaeon SCGC-AAA382F02 TaxID=1698282 RepID=A0A133VIF0_9EURY|nr:hypothetical protein AKJ53_01045 [candidate division MSBL1 archaeon SCGC-AAA382F02]
MVKSEGDPSMRPQSLGGDQKRKFLGIIGIVLVVVAIASFFIFLNPFGSEKDEMPYFSEISLQDKKISTDGKTILKAEVQNPRENTYKDWKIEIISFSPKVEITPTSDVETEYENLANSPGYALYAFTQYELGKGEHTKGFTFDVSGDLYSGLVSMKVKIEAHVLINGEVTDNQTFELTITS